MSVKQAEGIYKPQNTPIIIGDDIIVKAIEDSADIVVPELKIKEFSYNNGVLCESCFDTPNTIYVIKYDFSLDDKTITLPKNCVLDFQGGSLDNGILRTQNTKFVGSGYIFKENLTFSLCDSDPGIGTLRNLVLLAEWFGIEPYYNSGLVDQTLKINKAIETCYNLKVRTLLFGSGRFYIGQSVNIGNNNNSENYWDINIVGTSNNYKCGTVFHLAENACFNVNVVEGGGTHRGGGIYNCCFMDYSQTRKGDGIVLRGVKTFTIYKCRFVYLNQAIKFSLNSYFNHVESCLFSYCKDGIIAESESIQDNNNNISYANNNIISGCWFDRCDTPMDLRGGHCIHVYDTDLEGDNGTLYLGDHNRLENVRLERNYVNTVWLEIGSDCTVDVEIHESDENNNAWRCVIDGNRNDIRIKFYTFNNYGFISYGKGNKFDITVETSINSSNCATYMVYDPEDTLIVDGQSNMYDYEGENLISYVNFTRQNTSPQTYRGRNCYPIINNNNQTLMMRRSEGGSGLISLSTYYITCKFRVDTTNIENKIKLGLLENPNQTSDKTTIGDGITINTEKSNGKWFGLVAAFNKPSSFNELNINPDLIVLYKQEATDNKIYLIDVVFSTTLLFERPVLAKSEGNTRNLIGTDGVIHFPKNKLNRVLNTFSMEMFIGQIYSNWLGKRFRFSPTNEKYYSDDGFEVSTKTVQTIINFAGLCPTNEKYYSDDGFEVSTKTEQTIIHFVGLLQGLTDVEVELFDAKTLNMLRFRAWRQNVVENFSWQILHTTGPTINAINAYGTIAVVDFENEPIHWILLKPRQKGDIIYKSSSQKLVWWNGSIEVDL